MDALPWARRSRRGGLRPRGGRPVIAELLEALGCSWTGIGMEPDGLFPRDPEPTAANLADLGRLVSGVGRRVGLAIDPDADRLSLVDEAGRPMGEDLTLALAAAAVLRRTPGPVVTNLSTSQVVEDVAAAYGSRVIRAPVGEVNVARRMQQEGAVVGGEGNGGVILPPLHYTRDAPLAVALVLQHLPDEGLTPSMRRRSGRVQDREGEGVVSPGGTGRRRTRLWGRTWTPRSRTRATASAWRGPTGSAWLHVRPSGTEPVVRLIAEAPRRG